MFEWGQRSLDHVNRKNKVKVEVENIKVINAQSEF
jgi:hypothetical protein